MKTYRVTLSARARQDLEAIRAYIESSSPLNADRFIGKLLRHVDRLEMFPNGYPLARENGTVDYELRQLVVRPYRAIFRVVGDEVQVLHVRHAARRPTAPEALG